MKFMKWLERAFSKLLLAGVLLGVAGTFVACDDKEDADFKEEDDILIWDFAPLNVEVKLVDEEGVNMLNPTVEGNWMGLPLSMTYDDKLYELNWDNPLPDGFSPDSHGRAYLAHFYGLTYGRVNFWDGERWHWLENDYYLSFGEFNRDDNHDLLLELHVAGIKNPYQIKVEHRFWWESKNEPGGYTKIWLDGTPVESFPVKIVLPRRTE